MKLPSRLKVAIIGGGIAGAEVVRNALPGPFDITLIEPKSQIECQALYPEYLVGNASLDDLTAPLKPFCNRVGAELLSERALYLERNRVVCDKSQVEFDLAVIAVGASQNYFDLMGIERTFSVNTLDETMRAKRFLEKEQPKRIAIIGSGLTGIETACALRERHEAEIWVIEAKSRILPQFSEDISSLVQKTISEMGIKLLPSVSVNEVKDDCITLSNGSAIDCDMAIWTAGIKPQEFVQRLDLPKKNSEWILTNSYLLASGSTFAIGDCAWVEVGGRVASKTAVEAEHQAAHMAGNLRRWARRKPLESYKVVASTDTQVALISLGCSNAVGVYGSLCVTMPSMLIHALKDWIDKSFIQRFK